MLDFSADASPKFDLTIKTGDIFSGNKTTFNRGPAAKMGNLTISVGNVFSGNTTRFGGK